MKHLLFWACCLCLGVACQSKTNDNPTNETVIDSTDAPQYADIDTSEFVHAYLVVADEGTNYEVLLQGAKTIAALTGHKLDQQERVYRKGKGIIVPENSDDEMYAGSYFPRRPFDDGNYCSIEMKSFYDSTAVKDTATMLLVAAMYTRRSRADSLLQKIKPVFNTSHLLPSTIYMGCMH